MGALVEQVKNIAQSQLDMVAGLIESDLKAMCPVGKTGEAVASIHIERTSETSRRIGGNDAHLYYADQGNGGPGRVITSTRSVDRLGRTPGKLQLLDGEYRPYVHGYNGAHFFEKVASKYR